MLLQPNLFGWPDPTAPLGTRRAAADRLKEVQAEFEEFRDAVEDAFRSLRNEITDEIGAVREQLAGVDDPDEIDAALEQLDEDLTDAVRAAQRELFGV